MAPELSAVTTLGYNKRAGAVRGSSARMVSLGVLGAVGHRKVEGALQPARETLFLVPRPSRMTMHGASVVSPRRLSVFDRKLSDASAIHEITNNYPLLLKHGRLVLAISNV